MFETISLADLANTTGGAARKAPKLAPVTVAPKTPTVTEAPKAPKPFVDNRSFREREPFAWSNMMSGGNI